MAECKDADDASAVYGHNLAGEQLYRFGAGSNPAALTKFLTTRGRFEDSVPNQYGI